MSGVITPIAIAARSGCQSSEGEETDRAFPPLIPIARRRNVERMGYSASGIRRSNFKSVAMRATTNAITGAVRMLSTRMLEKITSVSLS
jgi:hypothetical protein